ncbi:MAG: HEPN domain-containing protein [Spirochaetes bacterium]|nr:HEPN domain-containing protein [Spirochaetota bacterium]
MKKPTKEWFDSAEGDLLLINEIYLNENLTHLSAFHCQQAIEKSFKAIVEEFDLGFIKTHSLETLYNSVKDKIKLSFDTDLLIIIDQLYIDSRYPGELGLLPHCKPSIADSQRFFK